MEEYGCTEQLESVRLMGVSLCRWILSIFHWRLPPISALGRVSESALKLAVSVAAVAFVSTDIVLLSVLSRKHRFVAMLCLVTFICSRTIGLGYPN